MWEELKTYLQKWQEGPLKKTLEKAPERQPSFFTSSGAEVKRLYTPLDIDGLDYMESLSFPGEYPFTRGVQSTMYRGRLWTMRQYAGFGTARESNERYKYLLKQGQTGLSIAFDLPTQVGYNSDHPLAEGEVGKVGVAIDSLWDMETLLDGIPLDKVSTSMTINATAAILLGMYVVLAKKRGVPLDSLNGTIQNDILKEYVARGTHIFPVEPSMRIVTDIFKFCEKNIPRWNMISISGYHIREAGANAVQELAFTLANGLAYVQAAINAGLEVDSFAPRLSFFFNAHNNLFEEVAKFRAARRLWAKLVKNRFGAKKADSLKLRFHTQTAGCTLTPQQYENNVVRVTIQALAAVLGGTQSLHTNSRDEALSLPSEGSVRIALRTQQILAHENGVADSIDPLAGSYYIEALTNEIEKEAMAYIEKIDSMGGAVEAIKKGFMQREIQESAYQYQKEIESGQRVVVGQNKFTAEEEEPKGLLKVDPSIQEEQIKTLKRLKTSRDNVRVKACLGSLKQAALGTDNLMEPIIECLENLVTLGEICEVLKEAFGLYEDAWR